MITKELKNIKFIYNEDTNEFSIIKLQQYGREDMAVDSVNLNKVYTFSFVRFALRIMQRNWFRRKQVNKNGV